MLSLPAAVAASPNGRNANHPAGAAASRGYGPGSQQAAPQSSLGVTAGHSDDDKAMRAPQWLLEKVVVPLESQAAPNMAVTHFLKVRMRRIYLLLPMGPPPIARLLLCRGLCNYQFGELSCFQLSRKSFLLHKPKRV